MSYAPADDPPPGGFSADQLNLMSSVYTSPMSTASVKPGVVHFDPNNYHQRPEDIPVQMKTTIVSRCCLRLQVGMLALATTQLCWQRPAPALHT